MVVTAGRGERELSIALLGGGTVGAEVARILLTGGEDLTARIGAPVRLAGVAVRDAIRHREDIPADLITTDAMALASSGADVVVELIGGIEPARQLVLAALQAGSSVVTANKALIAAHGAQLHAAAEQAGVDLYYEAAVAGAIPLLHPLGNNLAGDRVRRVLGIVNGTTNFILTKMDEEGADYQAVLAEAQALGYAEADPTADVGGHDAAAKAAIIAGLAFHTAITADDVYCEGITGVTAEDVVAARDLGFVIKLLAIAEHDVVADGICVRVHPTMVPRTHPLAGVRGAFNAVFIEADNAGEVMLYGQGAGGRPTASAVMGDLVTVARHRVSGSLGPAKSTYAELTALPITEARTAYYLNLTVEDRPGVLAQVAAVFAANGVSISGVRQEENADGASLVIRTHRARDGALQDTVSALRQLDSVRRISGAMRVEGE